MSWLYSRVLVEAYSAAKSSGGEPSAPSKSMNMPAMFLSHGKTTERSRLSRFGTTCELLTDDRGEALLTWFREVSRARTSPSQAKDAVSKGKDRVSGRKWRALCVKYDRDTSSWKTHRCLFPGDSIESLPTLPKWGLMRSGELWEPTTPALPTVENGYGYWPTPKCQDKRAALSDRGKKNLGEVVHGMHKKEVSSGGRLNTEWVEWLMGWPIGHTALKPLATDRYQEWLRWHGKL